MSEKMLQVFDKTRDDVAEVIAASLTVSESCFLSWYTEQFRIQFENNLNNCDEFHLGFVKSKIYNSKEVALKNSYLNEICENCKYGHYFRDYNYSGLEGDFECKKGHDGADCDGLKDCDDFELRY